MHRQYIMTAAVAAVFGFLAGAVASRVLPAVSCVLPTDVVSVRGVRIVDENCNQRLTLSGVDGTPGVVDTPGIFLHNEKPGAVRAAFALDREGAPKLIMRDKDGKTVWLTIRQEAPGVKLGLMLVNQDKEILWSAP